jgi:RNase P/RNase MRP subunit p29
LTSLLITEATRHWVPGKPPTTTVELAVGDPVLAFGDPVPGNNGTKVLSARLIVVASDEDLPKILVQGRVLAVTRQTIVVQTGRGERAITVRPRTRLQTAAGRLESLRGLRQGQQIIALGQPTEYGQWMAGLVYLPGPAPLARNGLRGEVIAKDAEAGTLRVATGQRGEITVVTNEQTGYRIEGIEEPSFDDIEVGNRVVVVGRFDSENPDNFLAKGIGVIVRPAEATGSGEDQS